MARPKRRIWRWLALAYLALLGASTMVRWAQPNTGELMPEQQRVTLPEYNGNEPTGETVEIAYRDLPADSPSAPTVVLIHGSPMGSKALNALIETLRGDYRIIAPDLPGFGGSSIAVANYSVRTHAHNLFDLLDALDVDQAHLLGYSQGGGVILEFAAIQPQRTQSLTMLSAIGVQELELLGDYTLNHAIYDAQWLTLASLQNFFPHFGAMDTGLINVAYARNFTDIDQRRLRPILESYEGPMLILHGEEDALVPFAAAREHARLAPQARLETLPEEGHMLPFTHEDWVAEKLKAFIGDVESNAAKIRSAVTDAEQGKAIHLAPATGRALWFYGFILVLGTQITEDLTCIAAGILASQGIIGFWPATIACLIGIFIGDMLLYLGGRWLGRPALRRAPVKWFVNERDVDAAEQWFKRRGAAIIFLTRFIPGTRLPSYFAAGVLRAPLRKFIFYFMLAAIIWTPTLVGLSMVMGKTFLGWFEQFEQWAPLMFVLFVVGMLMATRVLLPLCSWEGRRLMFSRWRRLTRWEFWPMWAFYPPVMLYVLFRGLRHRCLTLFTIANPAMPEGGFAEESKSAILAGLARAGDAIGRWTLIPVDAPDRAAQLTDFMQRNALAFPVVLKPDAGQRGEGVAIFHDATQASDYLQRCPQPVIAQEFLPGREYGIFYYRHPDNETGVTWGITDKRFTQVIGDGKRSLRHLILADHRAICSAKFFLRKHADHLATVPAEGEVFILADLGTHCRGAVFLDGSHLITPALAKRIDAISQSYDGFFFGRYDVRAENDEALQRGEFRVIELNGVTSEATWIYDPKYSVFDAWKTLIQQWRICFEIAEQNRSRGIKPTRARDLLRLIAKLPGRKIFEA